jgi:hypothetical protein
MKITCALSQSQIEKLYANVYGYMLNKGNDFEPKQYMIDLFDKLAKKKDVETAAKFLQQVPSLIGTASFRPGLEQFEISTDILKPLINQFKRDENGLVNVVKYFNPILDPEVKKELVEKKANDAFNIVEVDSNRITTEDFDFRPYSALSTTFQEFVTQNPNDKTSPVETIDPTRKVIYTTLKAISSSVNDNTPFKELVYQGKVLKLKAVRLTEINPVLLDKTTKALLEKAGAINTSKNISLIASAVALSTVPLVTNTPPNALSGSPAKAASQLSFTVFLLATPQTLVCLIMAKTTLLSAFLNSLIN